MNHLMELLANREIADEYVEHSQRIERIKALPLAAFGNNPVYRILLIWEAQAYLNNINKQLDVAFLN